MVIIIVTEMRRSENSQKTLRSSPHPPYPPGQWTIIYSKYLTARDTANNWVLFGNQLYTPPLPPPKAFYLEKTPSAHNWPLSRKVGGQGGPGHPPPLGLPSLR